MKINNVLNLNGASWLKTNRKAVLTGFLDAAATNAGNWDTGLIEKWLAEWNGDLRSGELKSYCQVVVYWLCKRLKRA